MPVRPTDLRSYPSQPDGWAPPAHEANRGPRKFQIFGVTGAGGHGSHRHSIILEQPINNASTT